MLATPISKHLLAALAGAAFRSPTRRQLATSVSGALVLAILPILPTAHQSTLHIATALAASGGWLDRLNSWRLSTGVPTLTENSTWSDGDYKHALYMVKDDQVTHYETPGYPYYTAEGDAAARNSNIYVSSNTSTTDEQAIDWWMQAPFHAMGLMDPRLTQTGFGSYREVKPGWQLGAAVDVLRGNSFTGGNYPVFFPGNGTTEPLRTYGGGEYPDPLQACPGYGLPSGLPVFVQVGGKVATSAGPVHSFTGNGVALEHCIIDSTNPSVGSSLVERGGVILIPRQPLQSGVKYVVALTVNGVPYTWSFTVGPLFTPPPVVTGISPNAGPSTGGTTITITGKGFSSGMTSVQFGTTSVATFSVVSSTTVTVLSPAHAVGSVNVTVSTAGGTSAISPADQYAFTQPACAAAWLSSNKTSPQPAGTTVIFTATAAGSRCTSPLFKFWIWSSAGGWAMRQAYGSSPAFALNTAGMMPGSYSVDVWVEQSGSVQGPYAYETFGLEAWTVGGCDFGSVTPNPSTAAGTVTFTATAGGSGCDQPQYRFWLWSISTGYVVRQDFSAANTWSLDATTLANGNYSVVVHIRQKGSPLPYETWALTTVPKGVCGSPSVSAIQASPQSVGTMVHFTTVATGCASPQFKYFYYPTVDSQFGVLRDWSPTATFDWNTVGLKPGTYSIVVHVKQAGSTAAYDTYALLSYSVTGSSTVSLGGSPPSPQTMGTAVTLTASAPGGAPLYQVWIYPPGGPWTLVQDFGSNAVIHWVANGPIPGTYAWVVYARRQGSGNAYDSYALLNFSVT